MDPLKIERSKKIPSSQPSGKTVVMKQHKASNQWAAILRRITNAFFSTSAAGLYIVIFAAAIGAATFVENDFGTSSAQKLIYKSWWFELILVLFGISLLANIRRFRMIKQEKWATLTFHAAMIIILFGAGVTRYFGSEGIMHIREGSTASTFLSAETYLQFQAINNDQKYVFEEPVLFATLGDNHWKRSYLIGDQEINIEVLDFIPNPTEELMDHESGIPVLKLVMAGGNGRQEHFVRFGDHKNIQGTLFNFSDHQLASAFNIKLENGQLYFLTDRTYSQMQMASQKRDTLEAGVYHPLVLRSLYSSGNQSFVVGDYKASARVEIVSSADKMESNSLAGLKMRISNKQQSQEFLVYGGPGVTAKPRVAHLGNTRFAVTYGAKSVVLPFSIKLKDFIMERYPGTNSASSYASEVTLLVPQKGIDQDHRIYMNNILNYGGYRFFQSSYDTDELGTYLSVNQDRWGTWISYIGYALLTLGMLLTMFDSNTRFRQLTGMIKKFRKTDKVILAAIAGLLLMASPQTAGATQDDGLGIKEVNIQHAEQFGRLVMQDHMGRLKPMNTFANELLRKISREEEINGLNSEQVILGMAAHPQDWYGVPLIKVGKHPEIQNILKSRKERVAFRDFFEVNGAYKLHNAVKEAYNTPQKDRGSLEKEMLKLDERVNICNMIFSGQFMKMFPIPNDKNNTWQSPADVHLDHQGHNHEVHPEDSYALEFYAQYLEAIQNALADNDWAPANKLLDELGQYQQSRGGRVLPPDNKIKAELLLNKIDPFNRLGKIYGLLGIVFLILLFTSVFKPSLKLTRPFQLTMVLLIASFALYTFGLGLRWYVSGRAPWSNGYESMIYIGFTTLLAGLIFSRKSMGGLAACCILASTILMVAGLSWLDPEITPLVPVLKSYWLTIHVSLVAGSYGFLMLGAIIGVVNLILMIFANSVNGKNTFRIIKEMTYLSEITLISGLFMISIGTYLGGVWANESWGRYWGWDAKETWALVTILVYAFILHMRFIPGFRGLYAFNVASLIGWASVMMTYFGVNYYLSGLHSYAAGDPVPIPPFVYYTVFTLIAISLLAYWRHLVYHRTQKLAIG